MNRIKATALSELLLETPLGKTREQKFDNIMNIVTLYNKQITVNKEEGSITIAELSDVFEDFDLICEVYDLKIITKANTAFMLGKDRDEYPFDEFKSFKVSKNRWLQSPFTVEQFIHEIGLIVMKSGERKIDLFFEPTFVKRGFKLWQN